MDGTLQTSKQHEWVNNQFNQVAWRKIVTSVFADDSHALYTPYPL